MIILCTYCSYTCTQYYIQNDNNAPSDTKQYPMYEYTSAERVYYIICCFFHSVRPEFKKPLEAAYNIDTSPGQYRVNLFLQSFKPYYDDIMRGRRMLYGYDGGGG